MRTIPAGLAAALQQERQTLAILTLVTRSDNVQLGFTDLDRDVVFNGVTYEANSAQDASAISNQLGSGGTNLDVIGLLTSDSITDTDLLAGRYDGATVEIFVVNYEDNPITERVVLFSGSVDECQFGTGHYTVTLRSLMQRLSLNIGELTSQTCLVRKLGDERCKINLGPYRFNRTVALAPPATPLVIYFTADNAAPDYLGTYYAYGTVLFNTGANAGLSMEVKTHTLDTGNNQHVITLQQAFPFAVAVGDQARLEAGCNRTAAQCQQRFSNIVNFRAFPALPGSDKILRVGKR